MGETVFVRSKQWFKNLNHLTEVVQSFCFISLSLMGAFLKVYRWLLHGDIGQFEFRSLTTDSNGAKFHWHSHNITLSLPCSHIYSRWTKSLMKTQKTYLFLVWSFAFGMLVWTSLQKTRELFCFWNVTVLVLTRSDPQPVCSVRCPALGMDVGGGCNVCPAELAVVSETCKDNTEQLWPWRLQIISNS